MVVGVVTAVPLGDTTFRIDELVLGRKYWMVSVALMGLVPLPNSCHVSTPLSAVAVTWRLVALTATAVIVEEFDTVKLVVVADPVIPVIWGSAQRGAGSVASGPATNAVRSNFRKEKFLFVLLFMDEASVVE